MDKTFSFGTTFHGGPRGTLSLNEVPVPRTPPGLTHEEKEYFVDQVHEALKTGELTLEQVFGEAASKDFYVDSEGRIFRQTWRDRPPLL